MASPNPIIAIITGAWQTADTYQPLRDALSKQGYETVCMSPPSCTLGHGDTDLDAESSFVRDKVLKPLIDQGKEVIVVMHSFGGVYGGSAVKGLIKTTGSTGGGIIAMVYMAASLAPTGMSILQFMGIGDDLLPWASLDESTGLLTVPDPTSIFFSKLTEDEAKKWAAKVTYQAIKPMQSIITYSPFEDEAYKGHLAYLKCSKDITIHPPAQLAFLGAAGVEETDELPTGHFPWLEMADATAEKVLSLANKVRV